MVDVPQLLTNTDPSLRRGWHPVARSSDLGDEPVPVRLLGEHWAIARLDDHVVAFADRCPHRLAPLSAGRVDGPELVCGYHGWRFVASGECTAVPALGPDVPAPKQARATPAWGAAERHGLVWLAPEEPFADIIDLPEAEDPAFDSVWLDIVLTSSCAGLLADNFLDTAHLPFVHADTIGAGEETIVPPYKVTPDGNGFRARINQTVANPEDPGVAAGLRPLIQRRRSTYIYRPPFQLRLVLEYPDAGSTNTIFFCLQPEDTDSTRVYTRLLRNDLGGDPDRLADAARFEQAILAEDIALQERFGLDGLPLVSSGNDGAGGDKEVSIRADAAGLALRRVLYILSERARRGTTSRPPAGMRYARRTRAGSRP
nr:aromatic ring-hydroxylating dioxygenase subunit alpha [Frankia sp. Cr2]